MGVGAEYPAIVGLSMKAGSFFAGRDVAARANLVVISEEAARLLFGGAKQAVGRTILNLNDRRGPMIPNPDGGPAAPQNSKTPFKVVGVYASLPPLVQQAFGVADFLVPYTVGGWPGGTIDTLYCLVAGTDFETARANLERYFRGRYGDEVELAVWQGEPRFPRDNAAELRRTQNMVTLFFGAFGLVALLVSSFGIFSIMTVNTLERTREIGLSRTIGATKTRVVGDFLLEALVLSIAGALIGLVLAAVLNSPVIKAIQPVLGGPSAMDAALSPAGLGLPAALYAVAAAALAGVLFGLFPAFSAARVTPVESLREG